MSKVKVEIAVGSYKTHACYTNAPYNDSDIGRWRVYGDHPIEGDLGVEIAVYDGTFGDAIRWAVQQPEWYQGYGNSCLVLEAAAVTKDTEEEPLDLLVCAQEVLAVSSWTKHGVIPEMRRALDRLDGAVRRAQRGPG